MQRITTHEGEVITLQIPVKAYGELATTAIQHGLDITSFLKFFIMQNKDNQPAKQPA